MISANAVERALRLINPVPTEKEQTSLRTALNVITNDARVELARRVANDYSKITNRDLLRTTFASQTAVAGVVSLAPLFALTEPLLREEIQSADIYLTGVTRKLQLLPDRAALTLDRPLGFAYGALVGSDLYLKVNGLLGTFASGVVVSGSFVPTFTSIIPPLDEMFVQIMAEMVKPAAKAV